MSTKSHRRLAAFWVAATLAVSACSGRPRDTIDAVADTMTTPAMRRDLTNDLRVAERQLQQLQDSVDAALGPDLATRLQPLREEFATYRKDQCERLKAVFKEGTFGPVAELECLIHLTDSRREFIEEHYDFVEKIGGRAPRTRPTQAHERLKSLMK